MFLYESSDEVLSDLGALGNQGIFAWGINNHDVIVGKYREAKHPDTNFLGQEYAFVWEDGVMHKLIDQFSDRNFRHLWSASAVNNHGEIVGTGAVGKRNDSQRHAFLARPESSEPTPPSISISDLTVNEADVSAAFSVSLSKTC